MTLRISVRGTAEQSFPAESASVPIQLSMEAGSRDDAYRGAAALQAQLGEALEDLAGAGGVRAWSSDQVRAHSWRDQHRGREVGKPRHQARVSARAEFATVEALERFADAWLTREGVTFGHIHWDLTPDSRRLRETEVRREAVADAVAKAADYAASFGLPPPTPVRVADEGMRDHGPAYPMEMQSFTSDADGGAEPSISLVPEQIRIHVTVEAEFDAD